MNLAEAYEIAQQVERHPEFSVLAIGHFVAPDDLTPELPWGVSVRSAEQGRPTVIWSRNDWERLSGPPPLPVCTEPRRDAKHRQQMSLF